jgi:hypothetical protein
MWRPSPVLRVELRRKGAFHHEWTGRFPERWYFVPFTVFEEVSAVTMPGHVTIYRYRFESPQSTMAVRLCIGDSGGGIFLPETFGHSHALSDVVSKEKK